MTLGAGGSTPRTATGGDGRRAVSTALDVVLAVVIVSGALVVLAGVGGSPPTNHGTDPADGTAALLATTTASVNYTLSPGARHADASGIVEFDDTGGPPFERHAHGTLADLLASAAVRDARLGSQELSRADDDFERAVRVATRTRLAGVDGRVQVRAVWRPYPGAPLSGRVVAGDAPPGDVTVHAATVRVPSGLPATRGRAKRAADQGYSAVASVVARATVRGLFTPDETWLALRADYPVAHLVTYRYRRVAGLLDVDVETELSGYDVAAANERLAAALAERLEWDMRERFDSPEAAAEGVSTGTVVVVVRTWSP